MLAVETNGAPGTNTRPKPLTYPQTLDGLPRVRREDRVHDVHEPLPDHGGCHHADEDRSSSRSRSSPRRRTSSGCRPGVTFRGRRRALARNSGPNGEWWRLRTRAQREVATVYVDEEKRDAVRDAMRVSLQRAHTEDDAMGSSTSFSR